MTKVLRWTKMEPVLDEIDIVAAIEAGFVAYSAGKAVIPPVAELCFEQPPGDVHIKYGYLQDGDLYVVKIASGFYDNPKRGLPSSQGLMLLFSKLTGQTEAILLDDGRLTDIRTAAAGAIAARHLAPEITQIGIVGTGIQARRQLALLMKETPCRNVMVWGRTPQHAQDYAQQMATTHGARVTVAADAEQLATSSNLIVTTTPSQTPLIEAAWIQPGTHITAVGADSPDKQELASAILGRADVVVADSIGQCLLRGEIHKAIAEEQLDAQRVVELGAVIAGAAAGRTSPQQVTVADLTGVAVQDLQIAAAVYQALS